MLSLRYVPILALHLTLVTDPSEYRTNIIPSFSIRYFVGLRAYTAKATSKTSCDANECIKVRFLSDSRVYNLICIYVPNLTTRLKKNNTNYPLETNAQIQTAFSVSCFVCLGTYHNIPAFPPRTEICAFSGPRVYNFK